MNERDFQSGFPGVLEPTTFEERGPLGEVRTVRGVGFVPNPLPPNLDPTGLAGRLYDVLDRATTSLLRLDGLVDAHPGRTVLLAAMRVREAQASSRIENTFSSVRDIALASLDAGRAPKDPAEVYRNRLAIEAGLRSTLPICTRLLCDMHRVLVVESKHRPGQFRDRQVCIGDEERGFAHARFVPPPPTRLDDSMRAWEAFCNSTALPDGTARTPLPYYAKLAMTHYQFEAIHPFSDGNGRLGRALVTLAPVKDGRLRHPVSNLSEWVQARRQDYYDRLLRVSTHGEWEAWVRFFCTALAEQADADTERAQRVAKLYEKYHAMIAVKRSSALRVKLLDHLFDRQAVTVPMARDILGVTYPAAQRHVEAFENLKIVKALDARGYGRIYLAEGVIRAIRGEGDE